LADEYYDQDDLIDEEDYIEAYCVRCRQTVEIIDPQPVWTRKGMPATRGECPTCGGSVFRMGKTNAHGDSPRPSRVEIGGSEKRKQPALAQDTVYVVYADGDEAIAQQLADDLNKSGIAAWMHGQDEDGSTVAWAGNVHPALKLCSRLIYVLSPESLAADDVTQTWQFFREKRKPIVIAQIAMVEPPDPIRRSPRFDLVNDYRGAFRQMVQALSR
jgi:hypothetical protein